MAMATPSAAVCSKTLDSDCLDDPKKSRLKIFWASGQHEIEENLSCAEVGGSLDDKDCKKNPHHIGFIPGYQFTLDHLKDLKNVVPGIKKSDMLDLVKICVPLTCRIQSWYVSRDRPQHIPGYPLNTRGGEDLKDERNLGSGWLWSLWDVSGRFVCDDCGFFWTANPGEVDRERRCQCCGGTARRGCWCDDCKDTQAFKDFCWEFGIRTARHVIYDMDEARKSEIVFFDHGGDTAKKTETLRGGRFLDADTDGDICLLRYCTHDPDLVKTLRDFHYRRAELMGVLETQIKVGKTAAAKVGKDYSFPYLLIGYPHGKHCYITVGELTKQAIDEKEKRVIKYDTKSCPGNSGCLGVALWKGHDVMMSGPYSYPHSAADKEDRTIGKSANDESYVVDGRLKAEDEFHTGFGADSEQKEK